VKRPLTVRWSSEQFRANRGFDISPSAAAEVLEGFEDPGLIAYVLQPGGYVENALASIPEGACDPALLVKWKLLRDKESAIEILRSLA
jgi:hypothetical protein